MVFRKSYSPVSILISASGRGGGRLTPPSNVPAPPSMAPAVVASKKTMTRVATLHVTRPWRIPSDFVGPPDNRLATMAPRKSEIKLLRRIHMPEPMARP